MPGPQLFLATFTWKRKPAVFPQGALRLYAVLTAASARDSKVCPAGICGSRAFTLKDG